jgi:ABC-type phosphate transport system substrate-binding protein
MYRLDGVSPAGATVRLSPTTVGKIFAGQIKMWNDGNIAADNKAKTIAAVKKVSKNGVTVSVAKSGSKLNFTGVANAAALKKFAGKKVVITRTSKSGVKTQIFSKVIAGKLSASIGYQKGASYAVKAGTTSLGSVGVDSSVEGVTITFPATPIKVAYRSGGSGTSNNFTKFLNNKVGSIWTNPANDTFTTAFPGGSSAVPADGSFQSASGSDGVANYVTGNNGAITYTELSYVEERKTASVKSALIGNNAGKFVAPSAAATSAFYAEAAVAADGLVTPDYAVAAEDAYLINAVSYGLGATANTTANVAVRNWFSFFVNKCAPASAEGAFYAPLAGNLLTKALAQAAKVGSN